MKFKKSVLLDLITVTEQNHHARSAEYKAALEAYKVQHRSDWLNNELPRLKTLRDLLSQKIKTKSPLTKQDMKNAGIYSRWSSGEIDLRAYSEFTSGSFELDGKKYSANEPTLNTDLLSLRKVLEAIDDDVVTTSALAALGFRNLEWFFKRAAQVQTEA